jgi:hypothetical protein
MKKNLFVFLLISSTFCAKAQSDTTMAKKNAAALDSMLASDELLNMLDDEPKNYADISIGFGNATFSTQNQAVNATGYTNQLVLTPALFYYFKSGVNVGVTSFLTDNGRSLGMYQTGASVGYGYEDNKISAGISYTRYFGDNNKYNGKSIYQNEVFGYVKYAKPFIQPSISLGFANGNYKQTEYVYLPALNKYVNDSTSNKTSYFSLTLSAEHTFEVKHFFGKKDGLLIEPLVMLNAGSDKVNTTHLNKIFNRPRVPSSRKKTSQTNKMQLQSIASSINLSYSIGKFYLQPTIYVDYYLPETTQNRFSSIFSLTAGFSF